MTAYDLGSLIQVINSLIESTKLVLTVVFNEARAPVILVTNVSLATSASFIIEFISARVSISSDVKAPTPPTAANTSFIASTSIFAVVLRVVASPTESIIVSCSVVNPAPVLTTHPPSQTYSVILPPLGLTSAQSPESPVECAVCKAVNVKCRPLYFDLNLESLATTNLVALSSPDAAFVALLILVNVTAPSEIVVCPSLFEVTSPV